MTKPYAAFFTGQGGIVTSGGVPALADIARQIGYVAEVFAYDDYQNAAEMLESTAHAGAKVAAIGYSLGCTTVTYLGTMQHIDLAICIAESVFAQNHKIDHANVTRSVLFHGHDWLSSAGLDGGFNHVVEVQGHLHLSMDYAQQVVQGVRDELTKLLTHTDQKVKND